MDYARICFVIMPYGEKEVLDDTGQARRVDFDRIYDLIFQPAIRAAELPEGGRLEPRRCDRDFHTADISQDMFEYLEYSRLALTDITGLSANVLYELGIRHRARPAGTVIFRQPTAKIPFDFTQIKAFGYEYEPEDHAQASRELMTRVLNESLQRNRIDSPVRRALIVQREQRSFVEADLRAAENAIRAGDRSKAIGFYRTAFADDPGNNLLALRLGLLLKDEARWPDALAQFERAIAAAPEYAEAWREKGIAQNKLYWKSNRADAMPTGIEPLQRAIELNPEDYDAQASLGGVLKREGRLEEARAAYERALDVSHGHSYPLLNAIRLDAQIRGRLDITPKRRFQLARAAQSLRAQIASAPPENPPWSYFDLAEISLYEGQTDAFRTLSERGTEHATAAWQIKSFVDSLAGLAAAGLDLPGLHDTIAMLRERASFLGD